MPLVPSRLRRFLACALPVCASSLLAQRLVLAQRPQNALPPPARGPAPTDEYYRGEAPYPTATPSVLPAITPTATPAAATPRRPQGASPASATPQSASNGDLAAFLSSAAGGPPLKLSQARAGWKSMRIVRNGESPARSGTRPGTSTWGGSGQGGLWSIIESRFSGEPNVFLTRGRTINLNGDDHLLVYQAQFPSVAETERWMNSLFPRGTSTQPSLGEVTSSMRSFLANIPLRASLINTRQVAAMEDIEPFDFQNRFNSLTRDLEESFRQFQSRPSTGGVAPGTAPGTAPSTDNSGPDPRGSQIVPPARIPSTPTAPQTPPRVVEEVPRAVPVPDAVAQQAASEPLRRLFAAVQRYRADNGDVLPPMDDLTSAQAALSEYLNGDESWRDPVSGRFFVPNARLSARRMVHLKPFATSLILFYSEPDASGKRTVLRLDGIIRRVSPSEWDKLNGTASVQ